LEVIHFTRSSPQFANKTTAPSSNKHTKKGTLPEMRIGWLQTEKEGPLGPLAEEASKTKQNKKKKQVFSIIFARMEPNKICCSVAFKPMGQIIWLDQTSCK
jgi:hypothetical protein